MTTPRSLSLALVLIVAMSELSGVPPATAMTSPRRSGARSSRTSCRRTCRARSASTPRSARARARGRSRHTAPPTRTITTANIPATTPGSWRSAWAPSICSRCRRTSTSDLHGDASYGVATGALEGYGGRGLGAGAGIQLKGKVPALGFLFFPLFFPADVGPKVTAALYLDTGYSFYRLRDSGGATIDVQINSMTGGFSVGDRLRVPRPGLVTAPASRGAPSARRRAEARPGVRQRRDRRWIAPRSDHRARSGTRRSARLRG